MKKKFFAILAAIMLISAVPALACQHGEECYNDVTASQSYNGQAYAYDHDTPYYLTPNDNAGAVAEGVTGGTMDITAGAENIPVYFWGVHLFDIPGFAYTEGLITGETDVNAWSFTKDFGLTSKAGAGSEFNGTVIGIGGALGLGGCPETVVTNLYSNGVLGADALAQEINYPQGQGVSAQVHSRMQFETSDSFYQEGNGAVIGGGYLDTNAKTIALTEVTIDPYGNNRSFSGKAYTKSYLETTGNIDKSYLGGSQGTPGFGSVSGLVQNNGSWAGGMSEFGYKGQGTMVEGTAVLNANIHTGPTSSTFMVHGSSTVTMTPIND